MNKALLYISIIFLSFTFCDDLLGKNRSSNEPSVFLETRVDQDHTVEGERIIYEVVLYSTDFSIAGTEICTNPEFSGLTIARAAADTHIDEIQKNGKKYYTAVIDRFFVGTNHMGTYTVCGGCYRIGFNRQATFNDPFWGPSIVNTVETVDVEAPDLKIVVSPLPNKGKPLSFSGAVGKFEIDVELDSDCIAGMESCLLLTVSGKGDLSYARVPEVSSAFDDPLRFKSMTENRSHFIHQGSLGSEIELECEFIADKPGKYIIKPIEFTYFDTGRGKYLTITSRPLEIEVKEAAGTQSKPPVIMGI